MKATKDWEQVVYQYVEKIKWAESDIEAEDLFEEMLDYIVKLANGSVLPVEYGAEEDQ
jgi:hypothetical protein